MPKWENLFGGKPKPREVSEEPAHSQEAQDSRSDASPINNASERERAHQESLKAYKQRMESDATPTDDEKRLGIYKEFLEPQVRDALILLVQKGYVTIDSGYNARRISEGNQYIGFRKGMINESFLQLVAKAIPNTEAIPQIESSDRNDYLELVPNGLLTVEEWKIVWDSVAEAFPDRGTPAPFRDRFISSTGH